MMKCALVGNADSIRSTGSGKIIDRHDMVCRCNAGAPGTGKAEHRDTGTRADLWSFSTIQPDQYERWRKLFPPGAIPLTLNNRLAYHFMKGPRIINPQQNYAALIDGFGYTRPSTGTITAHFLSQFFGWEVTLFGFDFFTSSTWYRNSEAHGPHDGQRERKYLSELPGVSLYFADESHRSNDPA